MTNYTGRIADNGGVEELAPIMEVETFDIEWQEGSFDDVVMYFEDADGNYVQVALRGGWPNRSSTKSSDFAQFFCDEIGFETAS